MGKNINIILATTISGGIGKDNKLPWNIPEELKKFKEITTNNINKNKKNAIIMGRKTWESLPKKPLPDRLNIILTSNNDYVIDNNNVIISKSIDDALIICENNEDIEDIYIIGGKSLYDTFLFNEKYNKKIRKIYLTIIFIYDKSLCDTFIDLNKILLKYKIDINNKLKNKDNCLYLELENK